MRPITRFPRAILYGTAFALVSLVSTVSVGSAARTPTRVSPALLVADTLPTAAAQVMKRVVVANCDANPHLTETTQVAPVDPNGKVYGHYGPMRVIPVRREIIGTCAHKEIGRTDFYRVHAVFTLNMYQDGFGNWQHTPALGTCTGGRTAYQMDGGPIAQTPPAEASSGCRLAEAPTQ
jgi:hypothetical protein